MDIDRRSRYRDKILWISDRLDLIKTWLNEPVHGTMPDIKTLLAIFKAFQEITEGCMDLISMTLRDQDIPSRDDYTNIERSDLFTIDEKKKLREMNGLRNRIIHRYNATDEKMALNGIMQYITVIPSITERVTEWMRKN